MRPGLRFFAPPIEKGGQRIQLIQGGNGPQRRAVVQHGAGDGEAPAHREGMRIGDEGGLAGGAQQVLPDGIAAQTVGQGGIGGGDQLPGPVGDDEFDRHAEVGLMAAQLVDEGLKIVEGLAGTEDLHTQAHFIIHGQGGQFLQLGVEQFTQGQAEAVGDQFQVVAFIVQILIQHDAVGDEDEQADRDQRGDKEGEGQFDPQGQIGQAAGERTNEHGGIIQCAIRNAQCGRREAGIGGEIGDW